MKNKKINIFKLLAAVVVIVLIICTCRVTVVPDPVVPDPVAPDPMVPDPMVPAPVIPEAPEGGEGTQGADIPV